MTNMTNIHSEAHFEQEICEYLAKNGWLYSADDTGYDREHALFPEDVIGWLQDTQPQEWEKVKALYNGTTEKTILTRLAYVMDRDGSLSVLRHGFKNINARFDMCQFKPAQKMNPQTLFRYEKVRLRVMRQVRYSVSNQNTIDLVLFINGIPVATLELKTDFTQSVYDAIRQYQNDRPVKDPVTKREEPLLAFKRRALVHFAVSTEEVWMTTRLDGKNTQFIPFNMGNDGGKGNPPNPNGYRTAYLWERVLQRDAWLDIVGRFIHLEKKIEVARDGTKHEKQSLIFPRFHQWEAVTKLVAAARQEGPGQKYLVQHSAGSGKTNTISWLAHQLASLHNDNDEKVFDSVIVVTDRTVLDAQLQDAIYQFEHKHGMVARINDEHGPKSTQLVKALKDGTPIIVVTIQTFPYVLKAIRESVHLKGRNFAVIADEAHSSQTGIAAKKLKQVLTAERLAEIEDGGEVDIEEILEAEMSGQVQPKTVSYFAFTATPKAKTLELFGRPNADGVFVPYHVYSMQQAIEEGFILDVLKNYTPYKLAFRLAHNGQDYDDERVDKSRALKSLINWVRLHPYNIAQKVQIIVEHFRANVAWRLDGRAKAMVVTASRKEAVRYKLAIDDYIKTKRYTDIATLVAFSGKVFDPELGSEFSETSMNPDLYGRDLREAFATDEFQIMLVANKFQTGFDQPLLVAMYVDKKLSGVAAVQTLSRLNRVYPGKTDTFILDFVNDPDEILKAFRTYYRTAQLFEASDPNLVYDLQAKLDAVGIYTDEHVNGFVEAYYKNGTQRALWAKINPVVEEFRTRYANAIKQNDVAAREKLDQFRKNVRSFVRVYDFLSQIVDYSDTDLFKRSVFLRHLAPLISEENWNAPIDLSAVLMTHYNLRNLGQRDLGLSKSTAVDEADSLKPMTDVGNYTPLRVNLASMSEIIQQVNHLFEGENLTDADKINYLQCIAGKMMQSPVLAQQAAVNQKAHFGESPDFMRIFEEAVLSVYENHKSMSEQVMSKDEVKKAVLELLKYWVYEGLRSKQETASVVCG